MTITVSGDGVERVLTKLKPLNNKKRTLMIKAIITPQDDRIDFDDYQSINAAIAQTRKKPIRRGEHKIIGKVLVSAGSEFAAVDGISHFESAGRSVFVDAIERPNKGSVPGHGPLSEVIAAYSKYK